jgi:hypothetical protein
LQIEIQHQDETQLLLLLLPPPPPTTTMTTMHALNEFPDK